MANSINSSRILVAVGLVLNEHNQILMGQRKASQHQAFSWEFPGGKVESGESVEQALCRELLEEVGIHVNSSAPFLEIAYDYPDKQVHLSVHRVTQFTGEARPMEDQALQWVDISKLEGYRVPDANMKIVELLIQEYSPIK